MRFALSISILLVVLLFCIPCTAVTTLSGRVYDGMLGDESTPAPGMTISVHCAPQAQDPMIMSPWGPQIGQSVTDAAGYWAIPVSQTCPFYLIIISSSPDPHSWEGVSSVDGKIIDTQMIEYTGPLTGKTLTGNKFWYRTEKFSGRVFKGDPVDESFPLAGIDISCHCAGVPVDPDPAVPLSLGLPVGQAQTDPSGYWEIFPVSGCSPFYVLMAEIPAGLPLFATGATSVGGDMVRPTMIQYGDIGGIDVLQGKILTGNKFWFSDTPTGSGPTPPQPPAQPPAQPPSSTASPPPAQATPLPPDPGQPPEPQPLTGMTVTGRVFHGPSGPEEFPLEGVPVELFCSAIPDDPGASIDMVETDAEGRYELVVGDACGFYTITTFPEGDVIMALAPGGDVIDGNRIRIPSPLHEHALHENNFWVETAMPPVGEESAQAGGYMPLLYIGLVAVVILAIIAFLLIERRKPREPGEK